MEGLHNNGNRSLEDLIKEGLFTLRPHEKIIDNRIVVKTLEEQITEGLVILTPEEKLENGEIVRKTLKELVAEGLFFINEPFEYIKGEIKKERSIAEIVEQGLLKSVEQLQKAFLIIDNEIETAIAAKRNILLCRHT